MASGIDDLLEAGRNSPLVRSQKGELPGHQIICRFDYRNRYAACTCGWRFYPPRGSDSYQRGEINIAASLHAKAAVKEMEAA